MEGCFIGLVEKNQGKQKAKALDSITEIRKIGKSQSYAATARQFGLSPKSVRDIILGFTHNPSGLCSGIPKIDIPKPDPPENP